MTKAAWCEWISLKEQPPPTNVGVLVTDGKGVYCVEYIVSDPARGVNLGGHGYRGDQWEFDFEEKELTHWMALPAMPVKGKVRA